MDGRVSPLRVGPAMTMPIPVDIVTFGCRLNAAESDAMRQLATRAGLGDLAIVNTCAVTAEAERQARQAIRRLRRDRPNATIVVTGCAAQINPAAYASLREADHIIGNAEKLDPSVWMSLRQGPGSASATSCGRRPAPQPR